MERLTTNKDVSEMSMIELAYNSCYIKDGKARYRDFNNDWDARYIVRDILLEACVMNDEDKEIQDDHAFDETLSNYLRYSHRKIGGLIGLLYRNLWAMADLRERLKEYEDLEELIGIPLKELAEIFNTIIPEECKHPKRAIVLTDEDVDEYREAMEKQKAKKPVNISYLEDLGNYIGFCPNCHFGNESHIDLYCSKCGQKLDWSEKE